MKGGFDMLEKRLSDKNMSIYMCSKQSGIPYTTLSEVIRGKTKLEKCSAETVYRLAKVLDVSMEDLLSDCMEPRSNFEIFKSNVCHAVKDKGDFDFIVDVLQSDDISRYWNKKWYPEAFYLLAMIDYLSRINDIPLCTKYDNMRVCSLDRTIYPKDVLMTYKLSEELDVREQSKQEAIPEFLRFNIVESEVRNVV